MASRLPAEKPNVAMVAEMTWPELQQGSGIFDGDRELTNYQAIELVETASGSQGVFLNANGHRSEAAKARMSELSQARELTPENVIYAVFSKRPPVA